MLSSFKSCIYIRSRPRGRESSRFRSNKRSGWWWRGWLSLQRTQPPTFSRRIQKIRFRNPNCRAKSFETLPQSRYEVAEEEPSGKPTKASTAWQTFVDQPTRDGSSSATKLTATNPTRECCVRSGADVWKRSARSGDSQSSAEFSLQPLNRNFSNREIIHVNKMMTRT